MTELPNPMVLIGVMAVMALVPFVAIMVTSFVKFAVVLSLIRNALGVQQVPPNSALYGLSIILSTCSKAKKAPEVIGKLGRF